MGTVIVGKKQRPTVKLKVPGTNWDKQWFGSVRAEMVEFVYVLSFFHLILFYLSSLVIHSSLCFSLCSLYSHLVSIFLHSLLFPRLSVYLFLLSLQPYDSILLLIFPFFCMTMFLSLSTLLSPPQPPPLPPHLHQSCLRNLWKSTPSISHPSLVISL